MNSSTAISTALLLLLTGCSRRQAPEIRIAVGGAEQLVYLPTTLAQQLGFYEAEGVRVKLESFPGGAKSLQALLGGSADVVSGFYDHTLQMAAEGRKLKAFALMLHYPGMALVVAPQKSAAIQRIEDLKGAAVGVTAPGSSTHMLINYLLVKHGLTPADISAIGIGGGAGASAAVERGKVDAAIVTDPVLTQLLKRIGDLRILADARQASGVKEIFGTETYPASVLYSTAEWVERNPDAAGRLARAMRKTLEWMQQHSPEQIAEKMPETYRGEDAAIYVEALRNSMPMFSPDGIMSAEGAEAVKKVLSLSLEKVRAANVDTSQTFTNELVKSK
jgi:NitT/TauT family transport system substrate-binding protein